MPIDNPTNLSRIHKINQILLSIFKSAKSNKATLPEVLELLAPMLQATEELVQAFTPAGSTPEPKVTPEPIPVPSGPKLTPTNNRSINDFLKGKSPQDLMDVIFVTTTQLEAEFLDLGITEKKS